MPLETIISQLLSGDMFRQINGGQKKLKKLFIDKKIDKSIRDTTPLIAAGNEVLYIAGIGISENVKVTDKTKRVYAIRCLRE